MPSSFVDVKFDVGALQSNVEKILRRKLKNGLSQKTLVAAGELYKDAIEHYVPLKTGTLRGSATVVPRGEGCVIRYSAKGTNKDGSIKDYDYAKDRYTLPAKRRFTPGTYDHWNRHLTRAERQQFYNDVASIITEAMNE